MPQAPSNQMNPPAAPSRRDPSTVAPSGPESPHGIFDEATLHEAPAAPSLFERPEQKPTPHSLPEISPNGFDTPPQQPVGVVGAETVMTPSGGAARRAWHEVADAAAGPAKARYGGSADDSFGILDAATDPELGGSRDALDATRPIPQVDDRTELGDTPLPDSVVPARRRAKPLPSFPVAGPPAAKGPGAGPHGTRKLPAHGAPRPDTRTRSLASLAPEDDDEPPNEPTRLGELAGPDPLIGVDPLTRPPERPPMASARPAPRLAPKDDRLAPAPVHGAPKGPVPPGETVAAPGELAGLIEDLEARATPMVEARPPRSDTAAVPPPPKGTSTPPRANDGPPPPPGAAPLPIEGRTHSAVRRGLQSHLPPAATTGPMPKTRAYDPPSASADLAIPFQETDQELDAIPVPAPLDPAGPPRPLDPTQAPKPLEATHALVEEYDPGQLSMPGEISPLGVAEPPPLSIHADTGPMLPAAAEVLSSPVTADEASEVRWDLAPRGRRVLSTVLDAVFVLGLTSVPMLIGAFGPEVANSTPWEPDDVSGLLVGGFLTLPIIAGAVVAMLYVTITTALGGRSIGKLAFGLQVIANADGNRPGFGRALMRGLFMLFGALFAGLGPLWTLVDANRRAWHDKLSGTTVVRSGTRDGP